jgi:hypothetical protein
MEDKDFIPYQEALELKQLGFDEPCFGSWEVEKTNIPTYTHSVTKFYKNSDHPTGKTSAPTYSQCFRFFREKRGLLGTPQYFTEGFYCFTINDMKDTPESNRLFTEFYTYKEAEKACLVELIKIVKEKQI